MRKRALIDKWILDVLDDASYREGITRTQLINRILETYNYSVDRQKPPAVAHEYVKVNIEITSEKYINLYKILNNSRVLYINNILYNYCMENM